MKKILLICITLFFILISLMSAQAKESFYDGKVFVTKESQYLLYEFEGTYTAHQVNIRWNDGTLSGTIVLTGFFNNIDLSLLTITSTVPLTISGEVENITVLEEDVVLSSITQIIFYNFERYKIRLPFVKN